LDRVVSDRAQVAEQRGVLRHCRLPRWLAQSGLAQLALLNRLGDGDGVGSLVAAPPPGAVGRHPPCERSVVDAGGTHVALADLMAGDVEAALEAGERAVEP